MKLLCLEIHMNNVSEIYVRKLRYVEEVICFWRVIDDDLQNTVGFIVVVAFSNMPNYVVVGYHGSILAYPPQGVKSKLEVFHYFLDYVDGYGIPKAFITLCI